MVRKSTGKAQLRAVNSKKKNPGEPLDTAPQQPEPKKHCIPENSKGNGEEQQPQQSETAPNNVDDLKQQIQILLDTFPKCNFLQQMLQNLCDERKITEEMRVHFIKRHTEKRDEIKKQLKFLKEERAREKKPIGKTRNKGSLAEGNAT